MKASARSTGPGLKEAFGKSVLKPSQLWDHTEFVATGLEKGESGRRAGISRKTLRPRSGTGNGELAPGVPPRSRRALCLHSLGGRRLAAWALRRLSAPGGPGTTGALLPGAPPTARGPPSGPSPRSGAQPERSLPASLQSSPAPVRPPARFGALFSPSSKRRGPLAIGHLGGRGAEPPGAFSYTRELQGGGEEGGEGSA